MHVCRFHVVVAGYNIQAIPGLAPSDSIQAQLQGLQQQLQRAQEENPPVESGGSGLGLQVAEQQVLFNGFATAKPFVEAPVKIHPEECITLA